MKSQFVSMAAAGLAMAILTAGCQDTITPRISANFNMTRNAGGMVVASLEVRNDADQPSVPLLVEVDAYGPGLPGGKNGTPMIHPSAFVLNRHESRMLNASVDTKADVVALMTVKEAERGILLKSTTKTVDPEK